MLPKGPTETKVPEDRIDIVNTTTTVKSTPAPEVPNENEKLAPIDITKDNLTPDDNEDENKEAVIQQEETQPEHMTLKNFYELLEARDKLSPQDTTTDYKHLLEREQLIPAAADDYRENLKAAKMRTISQQKLNSYDVKPPRKIFRHTLPRYLLCGFI